MPGRPSSCARSGPSPTYTSEPRPSRSNASARRTTFLRSVSEPTHKKRGPSPAGQSAGGCSGENRLMSTPQSMTCARTPVRRSSRPARCSEFAITPAARRTTCLVSVRIGASRSAFATSWPWAMTTTGARTTTSATRPVGTRKCANATSGFGRRAASAARRRYFVGAPPRRSSTAWSTS